MRRILLVGVLAGTLNPVTAEVDALAAALSARVLPQVQATSAETLALNALAEADVAADMAWHEVTTQAAFAARQKALRERLVASLGGFPARTPLESQVTGTLAGEGFTIEKVVFQSLPGFYVTGNVYVPASGSCGAPHPAILVPCGHSDNGKAARTYQRMGILGAQAGFVTLVYDPVDQGERVQDPACAGPAAHNRNGALACRLGWNFGRIRVWDAMRALDYLTTRPDVDPARLAVAGNSGGGTVTALLMALDDRIRAAAPSCYLSTIRDVFESRFPSDAEQEQFGQLAFGLNHLGYALLRAPCPVLINAQTDDFFPYRGTMSTLAHLRTIAARFGWPNRYGCVAGTGPHAWPDGSKLATLAWFSRWLASNTAPAEETAVPDFSAYRRANLGFLYSNDYAYRDRPVTGFRTDEELFAAPGGSVTNLPLWRSSYDLYREALAAGVEARAKKPAADRVAQCAGIRLAARPAATSLVVARLEVDDVSVTRLALGTPDGAQQAAVFLAPKAGARGTPVLLCGADARTTRLAAARAFLAQGRAVLLPDLCGWGETGHFRRAFTAQAVPDEVLALLWYPVGRSLVGIRAENILDAAAWLTRQTGLKPQLVAYGRAAIPAAHARYVAHDDFAGVLETHDAPPSWAEEVRQGAKAHYADAVHGALAVYDWPVLIR